MKKRLRVKAVKAVKAARPVRFKVKIRFDERLRDWQDIAQGYMEGASQ